MKMLNLEARPEIGYPSVALLDNISCFVPNLFVTIFFSI